MSYEHRSNVQVKGIPLPIKIISIVIVLLLLVYLFFPQFLPRIATFTAQPFWKTVDERPIISETLQVTLIKELQKENADLKSNLHSTSTFNVPHVVPIVKKPPFTAYDSYIIDIGDIHVSNGDKVFAIGNVLLGEVFEVNGRYAKIKLYSSYGEKYDVLIGKNNIETTATGQGGGAFEVVLPKDVKIGENDTVYIPDLSLSIFGIVKSVKIDPARAFSTILFSQPINIYEQKWVLLYSSL